MRNAKRGESGSRRGVYLGAVVTLGLALSACGGPGAAGSATTSQAAVDTGAAATATSSGPSTAGSGAPSTAGSGAVTLNWTPPTENTDGTPLTNLAGYDIHYGTQSGDYTQAIAVDNPGLATYVVDNLTPGTYYFSVSAVNSAGTESPLSSEVALTVN